MKTLQKVLEVHIELLDVGEVHERVSMRFQLSKEFVKHADEQQRAFIEAKALEMVADAFAIGKGE